MFALEISFPTGFLPFDLPHTIHTHLLTHSLTHTHRQTDRGMQWEPVAPPSDMLHVACCMRLHVAQAPLCIACQVKATFETSLCVWNALSVSTCGSYCCKLLNQERGSLSFVSTSTPTVSLSLSLWIMTSECSSKPLEVDCGRLPIALTYRSFRLPLRPPTTHLLLLLLLLFLQLCLTIFDFKPALVMQQQSQPQHLLLFIVVVIALHNC